jgi:hypothetical protein
MGVVTDLMSPRLTLSAQTINAILVNRIIIL